MVVVVGGTVVGGTVVGGTVVGGTVVGGTVGGAVTGGTVVEGAVGVPVVDTDGAVGAVVTVEDPPIVVEEKDGELLPVEDAVGRDSIAGSTVPMAKTTTKITAMIRLQAIINIRLFIETSFLRGISCNYRTKSSKMQLFYLRTLPFSPVCAIMRSLAVYLRVWIMIVEAALRRRRTQNL